MRIGVDLGGTKIEIMALENGRSELLRERVATPRTSYEDAVRAITELVLATEKKLGRKGSVGIAIPGCISRVTGLIKNANSTNLIGHPLDKDLEAALDRKVRIQNDANCFALSETTDGAAAGAEVVFGIIAGTGVGGGVCIGGRVLTGAHSIAGEWGHNPLPLPDKHELEHAPPCYCGKKGCIETWCSGPAMTSRHYKRTGKKLSAPEIVEAARRGERGAKRTMEKFFDRFARAIAGVVNILDPDVVVLGGGLSNIDEMYTELPPLVQKYAFTPESPTRIVKNMHGDSSGVRGAAWLWREDEAKMGLPE